TTQQTRRARPEQFQSFTSAIRPHHFINLSAVQTDSLVQYFSVNSAQLAQVQCRTSVRPSLTLPFTDVRLSILFNRMRAVDLIRKKRDAGEHSREEIDFLISSYTHGEIPDYQMAAWLMAAWLRGLNPAESVALTEA